MVGIPQSADRFEGSSSIEPPFPLTFAALCEVSERVCRYLIAYCGIWVTVGSHGLVRHSQNCPKLARSKKVTKRNATRRGLDSGLRASRTIANRLAIKTTIGITSAGVLQRLKARCPALAWATDCTSTGSMTIPISN